MLLEVVGDRVEHHCWCGFWREEDGFLERGRKGEREREKQKERRATPRDAPFQRRREFQCFVSASLRGGKFAPFPRFLPLSLQLLIQENHQSRLAKLARAQMVGNEAGQGDIFWQTTKLF